MLVDFLQFHHLSLFWISITVAAAIGMSETIARFRETPTDRYYATPLGARIGLTIAYVLVMVLLAYGMIISAQSLDLGRIIW